MTELPVACKRVFIGVIEAMYDLKSPVDVLVVKAVFESLGLHPVDHWYVIFRHWSRHYVSDINDQIQLTTAGEAMAVLIKVKTEMAKAVAAAPYN